MHHLAAFFGLHSTLRLLLSRRDGIEQRDCYGRTPLMCSLDREDVEAVRMLLARGADVSAVDKNQQSVAFYASMTRYQASAHAEIVRLLRQHAARMNNRDKALLASV